ncbi:hypothetical protein C8R46DRAFT_1056528 [Mycena filopes]|nr:hypothetical protein C8R46DRAFT_1056528 [Mycena filopes]
MQMANVAEISKRFCAADADIVVASSDNVYFKLHRKNLELHSDIFANAGDTTEKKVAIQDVVHLTEPADVLDLLFQYMYRQPQPVLKEFSFELCAKLAEAAEKYLVYSAMPATKLRMQASVVEHPLEVLNYAARHNHTELADEAAKQSMSRRVAQAVGILAPDTLVKWADFYDRWQAFTRARMGHEPKFSQSSIPLSTNTRSWSPNY